MITEITKGIIDLVQLAKNIKIIQNKIGGLAKLLFVVKGDGYGHGIVEVSQVAQKLGVDYLGVNEFAEAKMLRQANIYTPILIMGPSFKEDIKELIESKVSIALSDIDFARALNQEAKALHTKAIVHVEIDTGMGRTGISPEKTFSFFSKLNKLSNLNVEGIFTHCSVAHSVDPLDQEYTLTQIDTFKKILKGLDKMGCLPPLRHLANSAALVNYFPKVVDGFLNMVRIGGLIYGHYTELKPEWAQEIKPTATVITKIAAIRTFPANCYIGYNRTYRTDSTKTIAVLPIGYGHGLDQRLSNNGGVRIKGEYAPIVGLISMGQTMVDISEIKNVCIGDNVELISPNLPASLMAQNIGVFSSSILTSLLPKVKRIYKDN